MVQFASSLVDAIARTVHIDAEFDNRPCKFRTGPSACMDNPMQVYRIY